MDLPDGVEITGPLDDRFEEILTPTVMQVAAAIERSGHSMAMAHTVEVLDASIRGANLPGTSTEGD